jgi:hypothetical protein
MQSGAGGGRALHDPGAHPRVGFDTAWARTRVGVCPRSLTGKDLEMASSSTVQPRRLVTPVSVHGASAPSSPEWFGMSLKPEKA